MKHTVMTVRVLILLHYMPPFQQVTRLCGLQGELSKWSTRTSSSITWELVRKLNSWAPPQPHWSRNLGVGPAISALISPPGDADAPEWLRTSVWRVPQPCFTGASPGELLELSRQPATPITEDALGVGISYQLFFKLPMWLPSSTKFETHCVKVSLVQ